uniref:Phosphodiesterase 1C n=1 Tax=Rousettus aegyptiacus TaxID=9407 RepID=A0A7J8D7F0_ROUAE|nr:phosphodiesterase 1C [Rousettus aegyptiacus]
MWLPWAPHGSGITWCLSFRDWLISLLSCHACSRRTSADACVNTGAARFTALAFLCFADAVFLQTAEAGARTEATGEPHSPGETEREPEGAAEQVANEAGDKTARPLARFSRSKSQNCLWNSLIDGLTGNVKEKPRPTIVPDPRPPEEILADELPQLDSPEALVKTSFSICLLQLLTLSSTRRLGKENFLNSNSEKITASQCLG